MRDARALCLLLRVAAHALGKLLGFLARALPLGVQPADCRDPLLSGERFANRIGAFEGAMYQGEGLYRPAADCIMFTRNPTSFCRVCAHALDRVIDSYAK